MLSSTTSLILLENKDKQQFISQLIYIKEKYPGIPDFYFKPDFEVCFKLAKDGEELLNMLDNGHLLKLQTTPSGHGYNTSIAINVYNDKIYSNGHGDWSKLEVLWDYIPNQLLEWIIRSDHDDLYILFHDKIISHVTYIP